MESFLMTLLRVPTMKTNRVCRLLLSIMIATSGMTELTVWADVVTDGSMGAAVSLSGPAYSINSSLGRQVGGNLFHSFSRFGLINGESAIFSGPASISNIISRVTGGTPSSIDGLIRSDIAGASLYLINPAGIMFGHNASLDVKGSFHASTADYMKLGQAGQIYASVAGTSILTSDPPSAFGFLSAVPSPISLNGSLLIAPQGQTISFSAGGISLNDTNLWSSGGIVNLLSVASPGESIMTGPGFSGAGFSALGPVTITEGRSGIPHSYPAGPVPFMTGQRIANLDASGSGGGRIFIRGGSLVMTGSAVYNDSFGDNSGSITDIDINGIVALTSSVLSGNGVIGSASGAAITIKSGSMLLQDSILYTNALFGTANGADIYLKAGGLLEIKGQSVISSDAFGSGRGGNLRLEAGNIIIGKEARVSSSAPILGGGPLTGAGAIDISSDGVIALAGKIVSESAEGASGSISIKTGELSISDAGLISTSLLTNTTDVPRSSGNIDIISDELTMSGDARIESRAFYAKSGSSGNINIDAKAVTLLERSAISASIDSENGTGGNIRIKALDNIMVASSPIYQLKEKGSIASDSTAGDAGHITLDAQRITVTEGASVSTIAQGGSGKGGDITVTAGEEVAVSGRINRADGIKASSIETDTLKAGNAGSVTINAPRLTLSKGGLISSSARTGSSGMGGTIQLTADAVSLDSGAGITTLSNGSGNAGTIRVSSPHISLSGGSSIDSSSGIETQTTLKAVANPPAVSGSAGNLVIDASRLLVLTNSTITTQSGTAEGGNITVTSAGTILVKRGEITASVIAGAGNGGNVDISADTLILNRGRITAQAEYGSGGNLDIRAALFIPSADGLVSASSRFGAQGNVIVEAPDVDVDAALARSAFGFISLDEFLPKRCIDPNVGAVSSFRIIGSEGLPATPESGMPLQLK